MNVTIKSPLRALLRAGLLTAVIDFLFSSVLVTVFYHSTFSRLWQGVAATLLGPEALNGGTRTVLIGIAMHICVAFTWSAVFLTMVLLSSTLRRNLATRGGVVTIAVAYGPMIWIVMSTLVIPTLMHRPPSPITFRWWVQFFGHIVAVGLPIVSSVAASLETQRGDDASRVAAPALG